MIIDVIIMIIMLSCGSDGKLYNNGCQMMRKNCGDFFNSISKLHNDDRDNDYDNDHDDDHDNDHNNGHGSDHEICFRKARLRSTGTFLPQQTLPVSSLSLDLDEILFIGGVKEGILIFRTKCPVDCRKAASKPVCGSDGQLYANR